MAATRRSVLGHRRLLEYRIERVPSMLKFFEEHNVTDELAEIGNKKIIFRTFKRNIQRTDRQASTKHVVHLPGPYNHNCTISSYLLKRGEHSRPWKDIRRHT